ncbi:VOC family protein [Halioxenophilus aromaticivorans]|uniref:VOC family protein n=2 Tax=Halioxenophilus aromaticivorans TaxID=1306992 RepID=A0AAV3U4W7_9ALTE
MFDHIVFGVSDYEESKSFFLKSLKPIGIVVVDEGPLGIELSTDGKSSLCIRRNGEKTTPLHIALVAENRHQVDEFYQAALASGGKDNGAPGIRPEYSSHYYAAFIIGPDGHNIEVVCHENESQLPDRE